MSLIKDMRKQLAVWWRRTGTDHYGKATFASPVQIKCRWTDETGEYRNSEGQAATSNAHVYVDRPMKLGDKLKKGAVESNTPEDPSQDPLALDIQAFDDLPDFKAKEHLLTAHL